MTVKEQMLKLLRLQELAAAVQAADETIAGAPGKVEEAEARFRDRNTEYVEVKTRFDEIEADHKRRNIETEDLQTQLEKFNADLMQVKNQREYAAILKEIDAVKAKISDHETTILEQMEELDELKEQIASMADHIAVERETVAREAEEVAASVARAKERRERSLSERKVVEQSLPDLLVGQVHRLEISRQGLFLSRVDDGTCQSCYVRVRPQAYQEIKLATGIHACGSCRRLLYHEATLAKAAEEASASTPTA